MFKEEAIDMKLKKDEKQGQTTQESPKKHQAKPTGKRTDGKESQSIRQLVINLPKLSRRNKTRASKASSKKWNLTKKRQNIERSSNFFESIKPKSSYKAIDIIDLMSPSHSSNTDTLSNQREVIVCNRHSKPEDKGK